MPDQTRIVFSNGVEVIVVQQPNEVLLGFTQGERFPEFKTDRGTDVYIVTADQISYIEQVPE